MGITFVSFKNSKFFYHLVANVKIQQILYVMRIKEHSVCELINNNQQLYHTKEMYFFVFLGAVLHIFIQLQLAFKTKKSIELILFVCFYIWYYSFNCNIIFSINSFFFFFLKNILQPLEITTFFFCIMLNFQLFYIRANNFVYIQWIKLTVEDL